MFINDVGDDTWEEINEGIAGANYGWPIVEGRPSDPALPRAALRLPARHGARAAAPSPAAPSTTRRRAAASRRATSGSYFFADFCSGWIRRLDPATRATGAAFAERHRRRPVDLTVGDDGSLYYLAHGGQTARCGRAHRLHRQPGAGDHRAAAEPARGGGRAGHVPRRATGAAPLGYQWRRNGAASPAPRRRATRSPRPRSPTTAPLQRRGQNAAGTAPARRPRSPS